MRTQFNSINVNVTSLSFLLPPTQLSLICQDPAVERERETQWELLTHRFLTFFNRFELLSVQTSAPLLQSSPISGHKVSVRVCIPQPLTNTSRYCPLWRGLFTGFRSDPTVGAVSLLSSHCVVYDGSCSGKSHCLMVKGR